LPSSLSCLHPSPWCSYTSPPVSVLVRFFINLALSCFAKSLPKVTKFNYSSTSAIAFILETDLHVYELRRLRKPGAFGRTGLTPVFYVTHACMLNSDFSSISYDIPSSNYIQSALLPCNFITKTASVNCILLFSFRPVHRRHKKPPRVSYYALFNGWQLPSLPSLRFRLLISFVPLSNYFGTLAYPLGCFPFDEGP